MLNIAIAQLNYTVGDFSGNTNAIIKKMEAANKDGADIVVFSELSVCGYYPGDRLEDEDFLQKIDVALISILDSSKSMPTLVSVIGTVRKNIGIGKPLHNALLAIQNGEIVAEYSKQLLPTYGIFDERRHFEPGKEGACFLQIKDSLIGFIICEDGWNDSKLNYQVNPFDALVESKVDIIISLNASPSNLGKRKQRHDIFQKASLTHQMPIVYVNQVGGQDQLVFDGASFAVSPSQGLAFEANQFAEDFQIISFADRRFSKQCLGIFHELSNPEFIRRQIILGLQDYTRRTGFSKVVVGCSGGIDSALTLALAVDALGKDNVFAITMPSAFSSEGSVSDSAILCKNLGIKLYEHPILNLVSSYSSGFSETFNDALHGVSLENLQARVRGTILMEYSNMYGALLLTTGNKSENSVGYATLYGDTNGGLGLIGDIYKTEVYALSQYINDIAGMELIPQNIIVKPPSAELAPGQLDTDSLPPYCDLDEILKWHIEGSRLPSDEYVASLAFVNNLQKTEEGTKTIERILKMVARSEFKRRQAPPIIRVRSRAFGSGRQMPIAAFY